MKKKLPNIYKCSDYVHVKNNRAFFCSTSSNDVFDSSDRQPLESRELNFVFNTPVIISTIDQVIHTKIVSKVDDHILTSDNKIIKLKDIRSID